MSYKLTITQKPKYLHAIVTGLNNPENVKRYIEGIRRACTARRCFRMLIEERLEGPRLGTMDVFQIVADESGRSKGFFRAVAYVDVNTEGDSMKFAETVAVNRGIPMRVFASVGDAERWLLSKDRGDAQQNAPAAAGRPQGGR
jgi:hypothetical protein